MNSNAATKPLVPVTPRGEATRKRLLASAEIEFGSKGFPAASVSSITQRADVGQGTFYLYFHSKEEVFATLVHEIAGDLCTEFAKPVEQAGSGTEQAIASELIGFVTSQPGRQRILSEAQFVEGAPFRQAQEKLFAAIAAQLPKGTGSHDAGERLTRAAALFGACAVAALQQCDWGGKPVNRGLIQAVTGSA